MFSHSLLYLSEDGLYKLVPTLCNTVQHFSVFSMCFFQTIKCRENKEL